MKGDENGTSLSSPDAKEAFEWAMQIKEFDFGKVGLPDSAIDNEDFQLPVNFPCVVLNLCSNVFLAYLKSRHNWAPCI